MQCILGCRGRLYFGDTLGIRKIVLNISVAVTIRNSTGYTISKKRGLVYH